MYNREINIGADVIAYMLPERHPMIMVDRIVKIDQSPSSMITERYISANEPVFVGHFPGFKLWPGIYTFEGLRQSCYLLQVLDQLNSAKLINGLVELQKRQSMLPKIDNELCQETIDFIQRIEKPDPYLYTLRIKLLSPVFAGCKIQYTVIKVRSEKKDWAVNASVEGRIIAKGTIIQG